MELYEKSEWPFLYWYVAVILGEQVRTLSSAMEMWYSDPRLRKIPGYRLGL